MDSTIPPAATPVLVGTPRFTIRHKRFRDISAYVSMAVLALLVVAGLIGPMLLPAPDIQSLPDALRPPAWVSGGTAQHVLGTDQFGSDELSRVVNGIRTSLFVSVLATAIAGVAGIALGTLAGYWRGWFDEVVMRIADIQLSVPGILLVLTVVTVLRPSFVTIVLVLALSAWVLFARVARAQVLSLREQEVVLAIRGLGASDLRILVRHVLPNITAPLVVIATFEVASLIIAEASLGYLGSASRRPPRPSVR
ncbi:ABC transporter permease [Amycolatopsis jejuensis]|uniref:ABC transporter permease n=1 Tax=Amycolatopsis jejuensis TaxID=330084 RepID=UPI00068D3A13|nr:ABC transporter permease [Amycolatopsis jejuensis]